MDIVKRTMAKAAKVVYYVAVFGVGASILLYHIVRNLFRRPPALPPSDGDGQASESGVDPIETVDDVSAACNNDEKSPPVLDKSSTGNDESSFETQSKDVTSEGLRRRLPINEDRGEINDEGLPVELCSGVRSEAVSVAEPLSRCSLNNNSPSFTPERAAVGLAQLEQCLPHQSTVDNWSFSTDAGNSRSCLQEVFEQASPLEQNMSREQQQPSTLVRKPWDGCKINTDACSYPRHRDSPGLQCSFASSSFSPGVMNCQHSTPDDQQASAALSRADPTRLESLFSLENGTECEGDEEYVAGKRSSARNTTSWHDWSNGEPHPIRGSVSLDDSIFLSNDMMLIDSPCANEICTAVTSMEQLEREVAGVLSDCGEMERRVGVLRRHDNRDKVAKRYSLGVADSVIASDVRLYGITWRDMSSIISSESHNMSSTNGRDSGYIWDDDLLALELSHAANGSTATTGERRTARSLSPQPTSRPHRLYADLRCSHGGYTSPHVDGGVRSPVKSARSDKLDSLSDGVYVEEGVSGKLCAQRSTE